MSFIDVLRKNAEIAAQAAASVADTAVKQTKTMASVGRVRLAIVSEEDKLKKAYTEIGRLFYRDYAAQAEANMDEYLPWCQKAEDAKNQIQRLTEEMENLKRTAAEAQAEASIVDGPEAVVEEERTAEAEPVEEAEEDTSIFADVVEEAAEAVEEEPAVEEVPAEEAPVEEMPEMPAEPTVGTLYIDVTEQD